MTGSGAGSGYVRGNNIGDGSLRQLHGQQRTPRRGPAGGQTPRAGRPPRRAQEIGGGQAEGTARERLQVSLIYLPRLMIGTARNRFGSDRVLRT